jgi:hypothetical protein
MTLAQAFELLRQALSELPSPTAGEAVRNRMAALFGRSDPLLETERFHRFLRQAHDAEVADVRMVGDNEFEVSTRPGFRYERPATPPRAAPEAPRDEVPLSIPAEVGPESGAGNGKRAGIRFRRGSRGATARAEVPMVGVVRVDEPAQKEPESEPKPARRAKTTRTRKPKSAAPASDAAPRDQPAAEPAESPGPARRPRRPRARKP